MAAALSVDHPPGEQGVRAFGSALARRVDADTSEQLGFVRVEHRDLRKLVQRDVNPLKARY
jgi:hypothetical protein